MDVVKEFGEVLTPSWVVKDMLNLIPEGISLDMTVLEPACGDGNFLVEIIERKLPPGVFHSKNDIIRAYASIWGIDIQPRNVMLCRNRLYAMHSCEEVKEILEHNIIVGNFLTQRMIKMDWDCKALKYADNTDSGIELVTGGKDFSVAGLLERGESDLVGDIDIRVLDVKTMKFVYDAEPPKQDRAQLFSSFFNTLGK